jgi:dGTPase
MGKRKIWEKLLSSERLGAGKAPGSAERTAFQQDYDRIVFTSAFRRMKDKTQVFPLSKSDYVRTRLTHSLEAVASDARWAPWSVARSLPGTACTMSNRAISVPSSPQPAWRTTSAIHPSAMPVRMPSASGSAPPACWNGTISPAQKADFERYEGNAQGFRIVSRLQSPANPGGLQLTSAVLATFTKYPRPSHLDSELDGKSGKKFGFFQQDADNAQVARSTGMVERCRGRPGGAIRWPSWSKWRMTPAT